MLGTMPAVAAQQRQPVQEGDQSVTVTGERGVSEAERRREASRFFDSHAVRTRIGQLARWHEPVCVRAWGLPGALNARIASRVMDIADGLGIRTNRAELCRPNVRIGFTSEPQTMVERAVRRNAQVIGFHYAAQRERTMRVRQPVQAWYVTKTQTGAGASSMDPEGYRPEAIDQAGVRVPGGSAGAGFPATSGAACTTSSSSPTPASSPAPRSTRSPRCSPISRSPRRPSRRIATRRRRSSTW